MPLIDPGKKAPAFTLPDQDGVKRSLKDYAGRPLVIFFYPKDMTSGCTKEACGFRDAMADFEEAGVGVLGISILDAGSKKKFADKESLNYPLLADEDAKVCEKYGVWAEKSMYGRTFMGVVRTTYLIGPDARVVRRWDNVKVPGHVDEVLQEARAVAV